MRACGAQTLRPGLRQVPLTFWNNVFTLLSAVSLPRQESDIANFYVRHTGERPGWDGQAGTRALTLPASRAVASLPSPSQSCRTSGRSLI